MESFFGNVECNLIKITRYVKSRQFFACFFLTVILMIKTARPHITGTQKEICSLKCSTTTVRADLPETVTAATTVMAITAMVRFLRDRTWIRTATSPTMAETHLLALTVEIRKTG